MRFERALEEADDECLSVEGALALARSRGGDRDRVLDLADEKRERQVGSAGTWVHNRNINFTDRCVKDCSFCSFRRDDGYAMTPGEVAEAGREAADRGATEVTVQGGINPDLDPGYYLDVVRGLSDLGLHVHAFSPQEIHELAGGDLEETLRRLRDAGLSSLPGTAAEILDDSVRDEVCPSKVGSDGWRRVVVAAHDLGIPTTATMMYGHVETWMHRVRHLELLREVQRETGGFTEFVPLRFVPGDSPLGRRVTRREPDDLMVVALARLFLGPEVRNVQASWVKLGREGAVGALRCGANDLGGTLMEEKISSRAGATAGQRIRPEELEDLIESAGMEPVQRDTLYRPVRRTGTPGRPL